jgi:SNF2 family DNA or RNA helicase
MKIQQVASGFLIDSEAGEVMELFENPKDNPRIKAMMEYLDAIEGKVIIWARFTRDIEAIEAVLGDEGVTYYGKTSDVEREENKSLFLDPVGVKYFVANPSVGGTGLNLQGGCNHNLYFSNSDNSIQRWQSEDRTHRIGTKGIVTYTDLVAKGSTDSKILLNLSKKKSISEMAIGEIRDWLLSDDEF